jgi:hypothetical protein
MTSVVLTSTLVTTEEKTSRQIYSMLNNYQLADAANLARADALQSFNYNFREQLENYLTFNEVKLRDETGFPLFTIRKGVTNTFDWSEIKCAFESTILLTSSTCGAGSTPLSDPTQAAKFDAAIAFVANKTIDQFKDNDRYGKFNVYLSDNSTSAKDILRASIVSSMARSKSQGKDFLEVVGCDGDNDNCPIGTFYFNIPLSNLTDEEYEALPRIIVKDLVTQEEIKMAILPRTNLRVYVPLRFFKALYEARKSAINLQQVHASLENYKLGFCGSCQPVLDPRSGSTQTWAKECPTTSDAKADLAKVDGLFPAGVERYTVGGDRTGIEGLSAFGAYTICKSAYEKGAFNTENADSGFVVNDTSLLAMSPRQTDISSCGYRVLEVAQVDEISALVQQTSGLAAMYCGRIAAINEDIVFKETNPAYLVKGTYANGTTNLYKIRISDQSFDPSNKLKPADISARCTSSATSCA